MATTYAIADLHGRFDLLKDCYAALSKRAPGKIVHLGDYIDRGPESRSIIEWLMDGNTVPAGFSRVVLKGNHEDMMVETLRKPLHPDWWIGNGGGSTLISYGHPRSGEYQPQVVPDSHINWLDALPLLHVDEHRVFVHAGVDPTIPLDEQTEQTLLWRLYPDGFKFGHNSHHVVHGHHQFAEGPLCYEGRTDLDTFAWYTGRIVIGVFDDDIPGGPVELIEVSLSPTPEESRG